MKSRLTAQRLRELLDYAPETGLFYWRVRRGCAGAGRQAGSLHTVGYRVIRVDGVTHLAHRLAWLHVHGDHPIAEIDHVNGNRMDNRITNLRQCSRGQNARNVTTRNACGFKGIYHRRSRWHAQISVNGRRTYLGSYENAEQAAAAYDSAARLHYDEFARTNETERMLGKHFAVLRLIMSALHRCVLAFRSIAMRRVPERAPAKRDGRAPTSPRMATRPTP